MTLKSPQFFRDYIACLNDVVSFAACAKKMGMEKSTVFVWLKASKKAAEAKDDPSEWLVEIDGETKYFHQWCRDVTRNCVEDIVANALVRARDGVTTINKFQGKTVYMDDPKLIGLDDATLDMLGYPDRLLRDPVTKMPVPETTTVAPSTDLSAFIMSAHLPKRYGKKSSIDMNVNARVSSAVTVIGGPRQPSIAPPLPVLEIVQDEVAEPDPALTDEEPAEFSEVASDPGEEPDLSVTKTDPDAAPIAPGMQPYDRVESVSYSTPTPPEYAPGPNPLIAPRRSLSSDELALLARLPADNSSVRGAPKSRTPS